MSIQERTISINNHQVYKIKKKGYPTVYRCRDCNLLQLTKEGFAKGNPCWKVEFISDQ